MLEGWNGVSWEQAAAIVYPKLRAASAHGTLFAPLGSCLSASDRAPITQWLTSKSRSALDAAARDLDGVSVPETLGAASPLRAIAKRDVVGLFLLALSTFVAAESLEDGTLWPAVRRAISSKAADALVGPTGLTETARDALDAATRTFGLPSARADGDAQRYYQTVRFNTGASLADLPSLAQWSRVSQGAPRWFQRWREKRAGFDALLQALARAPLASGTSLAMAQRLFPLLNCTAGSFQPAPDGGAKGSKQSVSSEGTTEGTTHEPLPLRLLWSDGFPELALDLTRWEPAQAATVTEIACGEAYASRLANVWHGAVEHRWLSLDLAAAPVVEVDGEAFLLAVSGAAPLFFDQAGNAVPTSAGAHAVVAWTRLQSTGTLPLWSQKHGASVALLDGRITTEDGEQLTPPSTAPTSGPTSSGSSGGPPRIVDVTGSSDRLHVRITAASAEHVLVRARIGDTELEASSQGHDVVFSGAVPAVVRGGYLRLRVEWRAAGQLHTRTLDVPLPSSALVVNGEWSPVGGVVEATHLRAARLSYAIGGLGADGPPVDDGELVLACGQALHALRDRPRPLEVWGLGEPLWLVRGSPHAGGVVAQVAREVVDHGHLVPTPLASATPSITLAESSWATDAWALVWERDGSCSAVELTAANGDRFAVGETVPVATRLPNPRAIAFSGRTIWKGVTWADDWHEGLDALVTSDASARALVATLLALRVPVLRDGAVARLLRKVPLAALQWASGDEGDEDASFDVVVGARRLRGPAHARAVLRELCLDLRLGSADPCRHLLGQNLSPREQVSGFQRAVRRLLFAGPLPAVEFVQSNLGRAGQVRAFLCDLDWATVSTLGSAAKLAKALANGGKAVAQAATAALGLPLDSQTLAKLEADARSLLDGLAGATPLSPALRSAFRPEAVSRHIANQHILRLTESAKQ